MIRIFDIVGVEQTGEQVHGLRGVVGLNLLLSCAFYSTSMDKGRLQSYNAVTDNSMLLHQPRNQLRMLTDLEIAEFFLSESWFLVPQHGDAKELTRGSGGRHFEYSFDSISTLNN